MNSRRRFAAPHGVSGSGIRFVLASFVLLFAGACGASPADTAFEDPAGNDPLCELPVGVADTVPLFDAGAGLLIGTDSGIGRTAPGSLVHDEIAEFVQAGMTPLQALRIATVEAARFLGEEGEFGRVAVGQRADLLVVAADPLTQLDVLRRPLAVFARGQRTH